MCWAQRNGPTILLGFLSLLRPMKSHKSILWAVREANSSDLFTKQSWDTGRILEWQDFNSTHVFLCLDVPT